MSTRAGNRKRCSPAAPWQQRTQKNQQQQALLEEESEAPRGRPAACRRSYTDPSPHAGSPGPIKHAGTNSMEKWGPAGGGCLVSGAGSEGTYRRVEGVSVPLAHTHNAHARTARRGLSAHGRPAPLRQDTAAIQLRARSRHGGAEQTPTVPNQSSLPGRVFFHGSGHQNTAGFTRRARRWLPTCPAARGTSIKIPSTGPRPAPHYLLAQVW